MYNDKVLALISRHLTVSGETIAVGESVTAGHLQAALSGAKNASRFFQGGITAYNLPQKVRHFNVSELPAMACNCVGETVVEEMAISTCARFLSDWGIGITGYAAQVPELNIHQLHAYFCFAHKGRPVHTGKIEATPASPVEVQLFYTNQLLHQLAQFFKQKE